MMSGGIIPDFSVNTNGSEIRIYKALLSVVPQEKYIDRGLKNV